MAWTRDEMAQRAAREGELRRRVREPRHRPADAGGELHSRGHERGLQSENGLLGIGPFPTEAEIDADLINAGKQTVTAVPGQLFRQPRSVRDDPRRPHRPRHPSARWKSPTRATWPTGWCPQDGQGMGGAMDLVAGVKRVVVLMEHTTKNGDPKIIPNARCR